MLRFSQYFSNDRTTNEMICRSLSNRLTALMDDILNWNGIGEFSEVETDDIILNAKLRHYFPGKSICRNPAAVFSGLYRLLSSEETLTPDLQMEYLLSKLIRERIEMCELFGLDTIFRLENRREIENRMREYEPDLTFDEIRKQLEYLEDLKSFEQFCFWDADYMLLETPCGWMIAGGMRHGA